MQKNWRYLVSGAAFLLLVGAGCASSTSTKVTTNGASGGIGSEIDAAVSGIVGDQTAEKSELDAEEQDASQVQADKEEISAYGDATYEVK